MDSLFSVYLFFAPKLFFSNGNTLYNQPGNEVRDNGKYHQAANHSQLPVFHPAIE